MDPVDRAGAVPWHDLRHVEGLRAVAVLLVVMSHLVQIWVANRTGGSPGTLVIRAGTAGVVLFFGLSGFLLSRSFIRVDGGPTRIRLSSYVLRRLARIVPAYWLALLVLGAFPGVPGIFGERWWLFFGFGQLFSDAGRVPFEGLGVTWSLSVEVAFYALLPLLAHLVLRRGTSRWAGTVIVSCIVVDCALGVALNGWGVLPAILPASGLLGVFSCFFVGVGIAMLEARGWRPPLSAAWLLALAAACLVALAVYTPGTSLQEIAAFRVSSAAGLVQVLVWVGFCSCALGGLLLADGGDGLRLLLASRTAVAIGTISYGIYLWHFPWMLYLGARLSENGSTIRGATFAAYAAGALGVTLVAATLSWVLVERPLLQLAHRRPLTRRALGPDLSR